MRTTGSSLSAWCSCYWAPLTRPALLPYLGSPVFNSGGLDGAPLRSFNFSRAPRRPATGAGRRCSCQKRGKSHEQAKRRGCGVRGHAHAHIPRTYLQDNLTPLHIAAENGTTEVVWLLINKGADVDARDGVSHSRDIAHHVLFYCR